MTNHETTARKQLIEAMSAVSEDRTCCGWASDWARTLHAEGGIWETLGRAVGWPTGNYDAWVWVSWEEAARLYGHETSAAVSVPPPATRADDRAGLRDRIAEVLADADGWRWAEGFKAQSPTWQGYQERADAVLAVLPAAVSGPVAGEQQNETPEAETGCAHCGKIIRLITGTLAEWWVHDPDGNTICFPEQAASSPRATPKPNAGVRQDGVQQ